MSSEAVQQKTSFGANVATYGAMPIAQAVGGSAIALKIHGKNVFKAQNATGFDALNTAMKNNGVDVFTRSQAIGRAYESYKDIAKADAKAQKKLAKLNKKQDISLWEKFKNLFKKEKNQIKFDDKLASAKANAKKTSENLKKANSALDGTFDAKNIDEALDLCEKTRVKQGKETIEQIVEGKGVMQNADTFAKKTAQEIAQAGVKTGAKATAKATVKGFGNAVKGNFIKELGWKNGKFNYFMTALQFFPNVINEVIPTFKNEGFSAGLKATGKTIIRMGADLVGYAAGGAVGRAIGSAIGLGVSCLIPIIPKGTAMRWGGNIGDMVSSMIVGGTVTKSVDKVLGIKEETDVELVQNNAQQEVTTQAEQPQVLVTKNGSTMPLDKSLTSEQVKQLAYQQAFNGRVPKMKYYV